MSDRLIGPGSRVLITDANGSEYVTEALSSVEQQGHKFPIVWVNRPLRDGRFDPMPWPADAVRLAGDKEADRD